MDVIAATIARLLDQVSDLRQVGGAIELDAVINSDSRVDTPAAFVVPISDIPNRDESFAGRTIQRVEGTVAVIFCLDHYRDELGAEAVLDLNTLRAKVRKALLGWVPDEEAGEPVYAGKGRLLNFAEGRTWWSDEYLITYYWTQQ